MNTLHVVKCFVISLYLACAALDAVVAQEVTKQEFVGSTPCDARSREFLGGLPTEAPCHCIAWRLTLLGTKDAEESGEYTLEVTYGMPGRDDPNQLVDGPTAKLKGRWDIVRGTTANSLAVVYRIHGAEDDKSEDGKSLLLAHVSEHLLHFLDEDKTLRVGSASWSYTLNRKRADRKN
jgi:hypothetical protein